MHVVPIGERGHCDQCVTSLCGTLVLSDRFCLASPSSPLRYSNFDAWLNVEVIDITWMSLPMHGNHDYKVISW